MARQRREKPRLGVATFKVNAPCSFMTRLSVQLSLSVAEFDQVTLRFPVKYIPEPKVACPLRMKKRGYIKFVQPYGFYLSSPLLDILQIETADSIFVRSGHVGVSVNISSDAVVQPGYFGMLWSSQPWYDGALEGESSQPNRGDDKVWPFSLRCLAI